MMRLKRVAASLLMLTATFAHAQNSMPDSQMKAAEEKLKATFSQLQVTSFEKSPVEGVFELSTATNTFYYYPGKDGEKGILIFGEMYDQNGTNLTQESRQKRLATVLKDLDLSSALTIGPDDAAATYVEFTDPECPYCHAYEGWLSQQSFSKKVQRKIIFMINPGHPGERREVEHVICSKDKNKALEDAFENTTENGHIKQWASCPEAEKIISEHQRLVRTVGVQGTPSFLFDGNLVVGFDQEKVKASIETLINQQPKQK